MSLDAAELCDPYSLQQALEAQVAAGEAALAVVAGGQTISVYAGRNPRTLGAVPIGCIAKLLTAMLACRAAAGGQLRLDADVSELATDVPALRGISVRHLLEHTHGLDDSLLAAPLRNRGFIDLAELLSRVGALTRWAAPGAGYSYGHVGAWLVGAVLERLHDRPLCALVRDELLDPLGLTANWTDVNAASFCPASGVGLAFTAEELARFGLFALERASGVTAMRVTPLPGWHPLERGVCLGFKHASAGWFGHQSVWPGASIYLRAQLQRRLALAVVATEHAAALLAIGVLGGRFPELFEARAQLPDAQIADDVCGVYEQAARVVSITATPHGLQAETWERDAKARRGIPFRAQLVSTRGILLARPGSELLPFAQLVAGPNGAPALWNGRWVLRRVRDQVAMRR